MKRLKPINILMADDDADDRMLMKEALEINKLLNTMHFVEDGKELIDYLNKQGKFTTLPTFRPGLILLDLNMPKIDGREALKLIKSDDNLKRIPVVVYTTSRSETDVVDIYNLGANSFICKPSAFDHLIDTARELGMYWSRTVTLPLR